MFIFFLTYAIAAIKITAYTYWYPETEKQIKLKQCEYRELFLLKTNYLPLIVY